MDDMAWSKNYPSGLDLANRLGYYRFIQAPAKFAEKTIFPLPPHRRGFFLKISIHHT
jgi:hypothetical protein